MNRKYPFAAASMILFALLLGTLATSSSISPTIFPFNPKTVDSNNKIDQQAVITDTVNGTVNGTNIVWEYGNRTFTSSGNFTVEETGTINETIVEQRTFNTTLPLINMSSINLTEVYWEVNFYWERTKSNSSGTVYFDNATFFEWLYNITNLWGFVQDTYIENYDTVEAFAITPTEDYLGRFLVNQSFANFTNPLLSWNLSAVFAPKVFMVSVETILTNVTIYNTVTAAFFAQYWMRYSFKYNIEASEWFVNIRDGDRLFFHLSAPRSLTLNYTEVQITSMWYYFFVFNNVTITYENGTKVPFMQYPLGLSPFFYRSNGTFQEVNVNFANLTAISTAATVIQAFHARISQNINNTNVNASMLTAWAVQSAPRLAAYEDGNLDGQLNLQFSPDEGLSVTDGDSVPFVGITEAFRGTQIGVHYVNHTEDSQFIARAGLFDIVNQTESKQRVRTDFDYKEFNIGGNFTDANMTTYFNEPLTDGDLVIFNFGVEYQNFPVTWVSTRDGSATVVPMNIAYDYQYTINTTAGHADLSPTITYGSLDANPAFKARMNGLGLATIYYSDFLTAFAFSARRVDQAEENVTSSRAAAFGVVRFSGPESEFSTINATGPKSTYTVNNQVVGANISVLNLLKVSASIVAANVTVFESDTGNAMSSSYLQETQVAGIHVAYRKDLILVSYPVWSGDEIVHDPSFSVIYVPPPSSPSQTTTTTTAPTTTTTTTTPPATTTTSTTGGTGPTTTTGSETTAETGTSTTEEESSTTTTTTAQPPPQESGEQPQPTQPVPGFTVFTLVMIVGVMALAHVFHRRKRK